MQRCLVLLLSSALLAFAADLDLGKPDPKAAGMNPQRLALIPRRMQEFVDAGKTAGIVTVVARHGRIASFEAVGYRDLETRRPMTKDTLFRIASLTKPITCAGIMLLVDEGLISVIDPVEKFLPEYKGLLINPCASRSGPNCSATLPVRPMNIEDLMAHTSGLPASLETPNQPPPNSLADVVSRGSKTRLLFEPGTSWNYSNLGYDILGRIIEIVSKQPYDKFLADRLFKPLAMNDTYFFLPAEKQNRVATLYNVEDGHLKPVKAQWGTGVGIPAPAGGLLSTAEDVLRFNEMMRNGGTLNGTRVLSAAAVKLMTISHTGDIPAGWAPGVGHGYGYEVVRNAAGTFRYNSVGSFVKGGAYRTYESVDPEKALTCILMMQRTTGGDVIDEINSLLTLSAASIENAAAQ